MNSFKDCPQNECRETGQNKVIEENAASVPAESLAYGIHYAFIVVLIVSILRLIGSFFIKNSQQQ